MATKLATSLLKKIIEEQKSKVDVKPLVEKFFPTETIFTLDLAFKELNENNFVKCYRALGKQLPFMVDPQPDGIAYLETLETPEQLSIAPVQFNIEKNYGAVGTNTNFTINNSFDFKQLDELITQNSSAGSTDRQELEALKALLQAIQNQQTPVEKGALAKFSGLMEKHSWLSSPIVSFLISQFFSK